MLTADQKQFFEDHGYLILEGFYEPSRIQRLKAHIDELWTSRRDIREVVIDCFEDYFAHGPVERTYFHEVGDHVREVPYKLNDLHLVDEMIREFAVGERLASVVTDLLSSNPVVCNTLLFERGSQQNGHFDTFYMPSKTPNMMCASWIAIDPVTDMNGPLFYYPKSHLIEPFRFSHGGLNALDAELPAAEAHIKRIIEDYRLEETRFYPQPGDVLIWHAQLLHGGCPIMLLEPTRASLVTHYWTVHDYPDPADRIVLGEGRYLLDKPHQNAVSRTTRAEVEVFVRGLKTPRGHLVDLPPQFDPRGYLLKNLDVFRAGVDPYTHYRQHGRREGRTW